MRTISAYEMQRRQAMAKRTVLNSDMNKKAYTSGHEGGYAFNEDQRGGHDPSPPLGEWHPEKPSVSQMLEAAPKLHWRKCWTCKHIGLHVDNVTPWVNCRKCDSQDTRLMRGLVIVG